MSTTESANNNTTVPPAGTGTTAAAPGSSTGTTERAPTAIANTTPVPTTTPPPGQSILGGSIVGLNTGVITPPKKGTGGEPGSYVNTTGSVELKSVGFSSETQFFGKLTYEVFDFYGDGGPVNPTKVFSGETSVVNWDESSRTGVIPINRIIPCKADTLYEIGGMKGQVIIKDDKGMPLYHPFFVPPATGVVKTTPAPTNVVVATTPAPTNVVVATTPRLYTTPSPEDTVIITSAEFDTILDTAESNRVVIRGPNVPLGTNEVALTINQESIANLKINDYDDLSVSKEAFNKLTNDGSLLAPKTAVLGITTTIPVVINGTTSTTPRPPFSGLGSSREGPTTDRPDRMTYVVYVDGTSQSTTPDPIAVTTATSTTPVVINGTTSTTPRPPFSGLGSTTTPEPSTTTTTTTTTTSTVPPLGTIDRGGNSDTSSGDGSTTPTNSGIPEVPRIRIQDLSTSTTTGNPGTSTTTTTDPGGSSTLSPEDQQALDDLLERARTADGVDVTSTTSTTTDPGTTTTTGDPGTTTTTGDPGTTTTTTTTDEPKPDNQVSNQEELLQALKTFSNIYITQDFTISDIINVPDGVTINGTNNPKITMSNTRVAFKITSSNVNLNGFTIQSANAGIRSMGIGVLVTRSSPESLVSVSNVNISNITFIDIGDPITDSAGPISVRGYNATQSSPNVNYLVPVLLPKAEPFSNINIDSCVFDNTANNAIDLQTVKNSKISNCTFNGTVGDFNKANGIRGVDLQDTTISDCYLKDISQVGIKILGPKSFNVVIDSNAIDGCSGDAGIMIYDGVDTSTVRDNQIINSNNGVLITRACTSIYIVNNNTDNIKEAPLIISGLSNNIQVGSNTFENTFGSTVVKILQSWNIDLDNNDFTGHSFEIGPGTAPKRGILISQSNKVSLTENKIENSYPTTDEKSCPIYFYRIFPQNPTLENGLEATPADNWNDFPWVEYFRGTPLVPGIDFGEAGLSYARNKLTSGELLYQRRSGVVATEKAWNFIPSFVSGNVDKSGGLCPYCIEGSAKVNSGDGSDGVVIGDDDDSGTDDTSSTSSTPPPEEVTYTLTVTNMAAKKITVDGAMLDNGGVEVIGPQHENNFSLYINFKDNALPDGARLPLEIATNNFTRPGMPEIDQRGDPPTWRSTVDGYIIEPSDDGNYRGSLTFNDYSDSVDDDSVDDDSVDDDSVDDDSGTDDSGTDDTSSTTPFWPRIITVDPWDGDTLTDDYTGTPPAWNGFRWWLVGDGWTPPPWTGPPWTGPPVTWGTTTPGFTTLYPPPTGCIEPPIPPINVTTTVDPEIPTTTLPPNEQCVYPAPILGLQRNFYREEDIFNLTTTIQPGTTPTPDPVGEEGSEEYEAGDLVGEVICDTNEDCNKLNY